MKDNMRTETAPAPLVDDECRIASLIISLFEAEKKFQFLRNVSIGHLVHLVRPQHGQPGQLLQAHGAAAGVLTHCEDFWITFHLSQNVLSYRESDLFHEELYDVAGKKIHQLESRIHQQYP